MADLNPWRIAYESTGTAPLVAGGAVAGVALAAGLPLLLAPVAGVVACAGWGIARILRRRDGGASRPRVRLDGRWAAYVEEARSDLRRYDGAVVQIHDESIRSHLRALGEQLDDAVDTVHSIAARGQQLEAASEQLGDVDDALARRRRLLADGVDADDPRVTAVTQQVALAERIGERLADIDTRLARIDAELDTAVVQAIEAGLAADDTTGLAEIDRGVDRVVAELDSLNAALAEVSDIP